MRSLLVILSTFVFLIPSCALEVAIDGRCVGDTVQVYTTPNSFVIFRLNDGYPVFNEANSTNPANFKVYLPGKLKIEVISGEERVERTLDINYCTKPSIGSAAYDNYLPSGSFKKIVDGKEYSIDYRTALGVLEIASKIKGFNYRLKATDWGIFVDCVDEICAGYAGEGSGWMYWVNYPEKPMPGVAAANYRVSSGDKVIWYFSRSMSETPETAIYKIEIYVDSNYNILVYKKWAENAPPVAKFSYSPLNPKVGEEIKFYSESIDPDGYIDGCLWDFGDGKISRDCNTTHTYKKCGTYNVTLTVFDGSMLSASTTKTISIVCETVTKKFERELRIKENYEMEVNVEEVPIFKIIFKSAEEVDLKVKIEKTRLPDLLYATIYSCFDINLNRSDVSAVIYFRIPKEWGDVSFYKYETEWVKLNSEVVEKANESVLYKVLVENFSVFVVAKEWKDFPLDKDDYRIKKALSYLKSLQKGNGGFANVGEEESIAKTSWAIMAIVSAKEDPRSWLKNGKNPLDYIKEHIKDELPKMGTADYARTILAIYAAGEDPRNFAEVDLVSKLKQRVKENGQIGDFVYTTIWGIMALSVVGEDVNKSLEWLKLQQNPDGGFSWAVGEESDFDDTAAAIQALVAAGEPLDSEVIKRALDYLKLGQNEDGGVRYFGNSPSNAASDSWTIQALIAVGINPREWKKDNISVVDHLISLQTEEGYFKYTAYTTDNPGFMTASALIALLGKPYPIKPLKFKEERLASEINVTTAAFPTTPTPTPTPTTPKPTTPVTTPSGGIPGFEAIFAIAGLLAVAYLLNKRNYRKKR
ncbi:MAG: PKD domain-containing protein [Archaeoglobaceae archaeon]